jgi:hypothetical protein
VENGKGNCESERVEKCKSVKNSTKGQILRKKSQKRQKIAPKAAEVSKTPKNSAKKFVQNCKSVKV